MSSAASARTVGVNLETLLVEEVGQFGRYQQRVLAVSMLVAVVAALSSGEYLFTTARIPTRCLIPECENAIERPEFVPLWLANAVPSVDGSFDNCQRFANSSATGAGDDGTCPAALFDQNTAVPCDQYVYENTHTIVYDYDLACDEWRRTLIGSARTFGTLVALPITGFVSDRWGRRTALTINAFNTAWIGALRYFADTYVGFVVSEFVESALGSGAFSCVYILLLEIVGPKYRVAAGATSNSLFSVGQILLALVAWGVPDWRLLTLVLYVPQLLTITYYWIMPESIRWYMSKGRYKEAEIALKRVARVNEKQLSEKSLIALRQSTEKEASKNDLTKEEQTVKEPWLVVLVFRHKPILVRCLVSPVWWITTTFIYYGLSINAVNMVGNRYLNYMLVSAVEIPGFWAAVLLMGRVGRRPVLSAGYWLCAACQVAYLFMPDGLYGASLSVFLVGKLCISMVGTTMYVYTAELYPTKYRHSLFAFSSMMGRIGSILAPLTPALGAGVWESLPFVLFAALAVLAGALVLLAPETLGCSMPDTMQQAARMGRTGPAAPRAQDDFSTC